MSNKGAVLAAAAAAAFVLGAGNAALADHHEQGEKVKCEGVNSCKGASECKTAHSECGGQNSCKGKGWVTMSEAECDAAKKAAKS
jgi:uncharacterized membrane protein